MGAAISYGPSRVPGGSDKCGESLIPVRVVHLRHDLRHLDVVGAVAELVQGRREEVLRQREHRCGGVLLMRDRCGDADVFVVMREFEDERPFVLEEAHRQQVFRRVRTSAAGVCHGQRGLEIDAVLLREEQALRGNPHRGAHDRVRQDFDGVAGPDRTDVNDGLAAELENFARTFEVGSIAADHDRQRGVLGADRRAGYGRIDEGNTFFGKTLGGLLRSIRIAAGRIDPQRSGMQRRQELVDDLINLNARRQHGDDDLGVRAVREIVRERRAVLARMALCLLARAIPDEELVLFGEVARHRETHGAEADECNLHRGILWWESKRAADVEWALSHAASLRLLHIRTAARSRPSGTRCREREVASAIVDGGTPIRPLFRRWVRGGHVTEGPRSNGCSQIFKENKKGALRPLVCLSANCCDVRAV
jgi:hypothetical protein